MHRQRFAALSVTCLLATAGSSAQAAEGAIGSYGLGTSAFSAGVTPPPGTYVLPSQGTIMQTPAAPSHSKASFSMRASR
jgi:hypothetical protein